MNVVVIGGTGLIGRKVTDRLRFAGHRVSTGSPSTGVNAFTGEGLDNLLAGAEVVIDVSNSPLFDDRAVMEFFEISGRNLLAAGQRAAVKHHVVLSVVGTDRLQQSGYFRAKLAQEDLVKNSGLPYSIVRSTQFYEFLNTLVSSSASPDSSIALAPVAFQPIAADDVAEFLVEIIIGNPLNDTIEIAGPKQSSLVELAQVYLNMNQDMRKVVPTQQAKYFGAMLTDESLVPGLHAHIGSTELETWFYMLRTKEIQ